MTAASINLDPSLPLSLPPLPFDKDALEPVISARTFDHHWGKHHQSYIDTTNKLSEQLGMGGASLADVIARTMDDEAHKPLNQAALQAWNHSFQWACLTPRGNLEDAPELEELVEESFGSLDSLAEEASKIGKAHFGSGWLWLVKTMDGLELATTHDAARPANIASVLLVVDLWEHAYYLDYQQQRDRYIRAVVAQHWNWSFGQSRLENGSV